MLDLPGDVTNLPRAAGGGNDVEILRPRGITGSHAEDSFTRSARPGFSFTDGDVVFARRQMRDGDG